MLDNTYLHTKSGGIIFGRYKDMLGMLGILLGIFGRYLENKISR